MVEEDLAEEGKGPRDGRPTRTSPCSAFLHLGPYSRRWLGRWVAAAWLFAALGCSREDPTARRLEIELRPKIDRSQSLTYVERVFPENGEAVLFHFTTDDATTFYLAVKRRAENDPASAASTILVSDSVGLGGFLLKRGSSLERRLLDLLPGCRCANSAKPSSGEEFPPSPDSLRWLISRIVSRS